MSAIYIMKIKEIATRHALALQIRKTPHAKVQSAKRTHFTVMRYNHMLILQQRLSGTEMKDWGCFQVLEKEI